MPSMRLARVLNFLLVQMLLVLSVLVMGKIFPSQRWFLLYMNYTVALAFEIGVPVALYFLSRLYTNITVRNFTWRAMLIIFLLLSAPCLLITLLWWAFPLA
jgi:hypothetical protein